MSAYCKDNYELCFTDLPLHNVLSEWIINNMQVPTSAAIWLTHIGLFLLTWYFVKYTIRLVLSIWWPFMIMVILIFLRSIQHSEPEEFRASLFEKCGTFYHWMVKASATISDVFLKFIQSRSLSDIEETM